MSHIRVVNESHVTLVLYASVPGERGARAQRRGHDLLAGARAVPRVPAADGARLRVVAALRRAARARPARAAHHTHARIGQYSLWRKWIPP